MLATRVLQKEGTFYFIAYKATELLDRVSFSSRYYFEGEQIDADEPGDDEVAKFIAGIEKSEKSFQRLLNRRKIGQIVNFYETAVSQPLIPGTILLGRNTALPALGRFGQRRFPERAKREVSGYRRSASSCSAAFFPPKTSGADRSDRGSLCAVRRQERRLRHRDVRDHQFDPHEDQ